jgi:hypothetical protein
MLERDLDHTHTRYMDDCGGRGAYFNIIITVESGHWPLACHLFEGASDGSEVRRPPRCFVWVLVGYSKVAASILHACIHHHIQSPSYSTNTP